MKDDQLQQLALEYGQELAFSIQSQPFGPDCEVFKIFDKMFMSIGAIKEMLNANAVQTTDEYVEQLMAKGKSYIEKGRKLKSGNH
jgi:predicted DNA-binding protein (MmcQ/YjbR family)